MPDAAELVVAPLASVEYARTPFVVVVHKDIGLQHVSAVQLAAFFEPGAVFPRGQRARPVLRLKDATDTKLLKSFAPEVERAITAAEARRGMLDAATDSDAADLVQNTPGAFAASTLAQVLTEDRPFVALTIDGRQPTVESLAKGDYPYYKRLIAITQAKPSAATSAFMGFLRSDSAQKLLGAHGHMNV